MAIHRGRMIQHTAEVALKVRCAGFSCISWWSCTVQPAVNLSSLPSPCVWSSRRSILSTPAFNQSASYRGTTGSCECDFSVMTGNRSNCYLKTTMEAPQQVSKDAFIASVSSLKEGVFALLPTDGRQFDLQTSLLLLIGLFKVSVFYKQPFLLPTCQWP